MRCSEPLRASRHLLPPPPFHPPCRCRAALPVAELGVVRRCYVFPVTETKKEHWLRGPIQIRKFRAMNSLILAIPCVIMASLLSVPVVSLRPRLDRDGHQIMRPDGRPAFERDWFGDIDVQWPSYSCLMLGGFFLFRAAFIRFRPLSTSQPNDRNA